MSDDVIEIDEHGVGFVGSHHFYLRFVIELVPLPRSAAGDSNSNRYTVI